MDRKHNVTLAIIPDPDPQRYERFFEMIVPSLCLLRNLPGFYKRMQHHDGNTINRLKPIEFVATNSEVSMAVAGPDVPNGMTISYKLYTEGYGGPGIFLNYAKIIAHIKFRHFTLPCTKLG
jgi:hypothetical protein